MRFSYKYIALLLILIYILFGVINFFNYKYDYVHNDYIENETITLFTNNRNADQFFKEIKQFDKIISTIYVDPSYGALKINALKKISFIDLKTTLSLISKPDLSYLLNNLYTMINNSLESEKIDKHLIYNKIKLLNEVLKEIKNYFLKDKLHDEIGDRIFNRIIQNKNGFYKEYDYSIDIIPQEYKDYKSKKENYEKLFDLIGNINKEYFIIDSIVFKNKYIYNDFVEYNDNSNIYNIQYKNYIIAYSEQLSSLRKSIHELNKLNIENISILDFMTDSSLSGEKYKLLKKAEHDVKYQKKVPLGEYLDTHDLILNRILDFENLLFDIDKNLTNYNFTPKRTYEINRTIKEILKNINIIVSKLEDKSMKYKVNYMIQDYNLKSIKNYNKLINTEPVDFDFVNSAIKNKYYNHSNGFYLVEILNYEKSQYSKINQIFKNKTSIDN